MLQNHLQILFMLSFCRGIVLAKLFASHQAEEQRGMA
jgi:hypothetical protein